MTGSRRSSYPVCNRYAKKMDNLHHGPISGRHWLSVGISALKSNSYANAGSWADLVHAFTEPLKDSPLDELILLLHTGTPSSDKRQSKHIRPVFYNRLDEVHDLLFSIIPSTSRSDAAPTDKRPSRGNGETGNRGGQGQQKHVGIPQGRIAGGKGAVGVAHEEEFSQARVNAAKIVQGAYRRHLERKRVEAARKIQVTYRRHLKKAVVNEGVDAAQAHYWHLLRKRSTKMRWPKDSRYYLLFRVPLAYILVCLDTVKAFVESEKKEAKKRMMTEDHGGLEELMEALNQYRCDGADYTSDRGSNKSFSKLLKQTIALQKKLYPSSKFHEGQSVNDLQYAILEVEVIVEGLDSIPGSTGTRNQIKGQWDRGRKWILEKQGSGREEFIADLELVWGNFCDP